MPSKTCKDQCNWSETHRVIHKTQTLQQENLAWLLSWKRAQHRRRKALRDRNFNGKQIKGHHYSMGWRWKETSIESPFHGYNMQIRFFGAFECGLPLQQRIWNKAVKEWTVNSQTGELANPLSEKQRERKKWNKVEKLAIFTTVCHRAERKIIFSILCGFSIWWGKLLNF